jgi:endonuclease YncB( thermonuclease family)
MSDECDRKKYKGKVKINGKIFLDQFFSLGGRSDADTVRVYLNPSSVEFRRSEENDWQRNLTLFDKAYYYDEEEKTWKKIVVTDRGHNEQEYMKIRLQGIDAPELHCLANMGDLYLDYSHFTNFKSLNVMFEYRQHWGARAATELAKFLKCNSTKDNGEEFVEAYAISSVDKPHDLFDKFGRAVADIFIIKNNGEEENLNQWLVREGWAFPDYYDSMSNEEIRILIEQNKKANNPKGIRSSYTKELIPFNFNLFYRKDDEIQSDKGPVNLPKFFRKQIDYEALKKSGFKKDSRSKFELSTLKKYIEYRQNKCYKLEEFLKERHCSKQYALSEFIDETGYMQVEPGSLVNIESDSKIESINVIDRWY